MAGPIQTEYVEAAALAAPVSTDDLREILGNIQSVASTNLASLLEDSLTHRTEAVEVLRFKAHEPVLLAIHPHTWEDHFGHLGLSDEEKEAVEKAYYEYALESASHDTNNLQAETIEEFEGNLLVIQIPEGWGQALLVTAWQFIEFARQGLTPAEMLDYWIIETQEMPLSEWATDRGVQREAVRKNIRQGKSKLKSNQ